MHIIISNYFFNYEKKLKYRRQNQEALSIFTFLNCRRCSVTVIVFSVAVTGCLLRVSRRKLAPLSGKKNIPFEFGNITPKAIESACQFLSDSEAEKSVRCRMQLEIEVFLNLKCV